MKVSVRLSIDTRIWINKLEKIYSTEFGGLSLAQGHVVSKAYHTVTNNHKNISDDYWLKVKEKKLKFTDIEINSMESNSLADSKTALNLSDETIEGIIQMQKSLRVPLNVARVNTGFCIQLIVKAALYEAQDNLIL